MEENFTEKKDLPSRSTRGKRMTNLIEEEIEADESFWGQEFFKEEEGDNQYVSEEDEEDVKDEDFYDPSNEVVEPLESEPDKKDDKEKKKRKIYVDPQSRQGKKHKHSGKSKESLTDAIPTTPQPQTGAKGKKLVQSDRIIRTTTKDKTNKTEGKREKEHIKKEKKRVEREKRKSQVHILEMTQEDLLEEAKTTEIYNVASVEILTRLAEEKKKVLPRPSLEGPLIRFLSKQGINTITFTESSSFPDFINSKPIQYPQQLKCSITGMPAKYIDPLTMAPYTTIESFKVIRENFLQNQEKKSTS